MRQPPAPDGIPYRKYPGKADPAAGFSPVIHPFSDENNIRLLREVIRVRYHILLK